MSRMLSLELETTVAAAASNLAQAQTADPQPRVLVVIPTLNEAARIADVLRELLAHPPDAAAFRVVVVDGGSSDDTVAIASSIAEEHPEVAVLHNPARWQSAATNLAARTFGREFDVLVRCDAHAAYPERFCQRLLDSLSTHGADAVVVPLVSEGRTPLQRAVAWVSNSPIGTGGSAHRAGRESGFVDHGHHAAFRMAAFRRAGGYDETFSHNEDAELDCRQRAFGARLFLDASIAVGYHPRASFGALARQYFKYGEGRSRTLRRHSSSVRLRQLAVPANAALLVGGLTLAWLQPLLLAWPALYGASLAGASLYFALRDRSLAGLWCGPAAGVMHLAWAAGFFAGLVKRREKPWRRESTAPLWSEPGDTEALHTLLVDPSLFTAPYDAALDAGLREAGVRTTWAVRPVRPGDRRELPEPVVDEMFYRKSEKLAKLPRRLRSLAKGLEHVAGLFALVRRVAATRPDVLHFQWSVVPWLDAFAIAFLRQRVPVVVTVHDTTPWNGDRSKRLQTWGADLPLRLADKLIVHTRGGKQALVARGFDAEHVAVIPHGPLSLKSEIGPSSRRTEGRWTFVVFGEIKPYKGIDVLVEALGLLSDELRARARVVIAGRPLMDLAPLRARIRELGLEQVVEIRPRRHTEDEMAELFHAADCFVFPYRRIDASGVYFLVKSYPKWLIASNVGIFAEDLEDGVRGMLVPPEDPRALASAMTLAMTLRYRAVGLNTDHDWQTIGAATRKLYVEARDRRARATWTAPAEALDGGNP